MTHGKQNKILDDKIESNVNQYKVDRLNAEISAFSNGNDIIKRLNNELKDNNLSVAESKKINDDIVEKENKILKRKQMIYDYEKVLEKRIKTDQNK